MNAPAPFAPLPPDASGIVSWIHIGDLHMTRAGEQNHRDLMAIVEEINANFASKGVSFVYLPGDIADDGSLRAYEAVRECLDQLTIPWCGIVGDHDVHEKSFANFQTAMGESLYSAFTVGDVRFFRLNAFAEPRPDSFVVDDAQLDWLEGELIQLGALRAVVLMHCYPSDLKQGGERLAEILRRYGVRLVDMGHTHYNELSNDGRVLYSATRSTGQIEEGPVGYSVLSLDGDAVSWHFVRLGTPMAVSITSLSDERLMTEHSATLPAGDALPVRVKVWGKQKPVSVALEDFEQRIRFVEQSESFWTASLPNELMTDGVHELTVRATSENGFVAKDSIRIADGRGVVARERSSIDQENALGAWTERDLLGTQLGPNKNGKKW